MSPVTRHRIYRFCCCLLILLCLLQTAVSACAVPCPVGSACQSDSGSTPADESNLLSDLDEESGPVPQRFCSTMPSAHAFNAGLLLILPQSVQKRLFTPPE